MSSEQSVLLKQKDVKNNLSSANRPISQGSLDASWTAEFTEVVTDREQMLLDRFKQEIEDDPAVMSVRNSFEQKNDMFTLEHSSRVSELAMWMALRSEKLSDDEVFDVGVAAMLHDAGKLEIDNSLLYYAGPLNEANREVMTGHTGHGERILRKLGAAKLAQVVALEHHDHKRGDGDMALVDVATKQEWMVELVAVADMYDALRSDRPYKQAFTHDKAISLIREELRVGSDILKILIEFGERE